MTWINIPGQCNPSARHRQPIVAAFPPPSPPPTLLQVSLRARPTTTALPLHNHRPSSPTSKPPSPAGNDERRRRLAVETVEDWSRRKRERDRQERPSNGTQGQHKTAKGQTTTASQRCSSNDKQDPMTPRTTTQGERAVQPCPETRAPRTECPAPATPHTSCGRVLDKGPGEQQPTIRSIPTSQTTTSQAKRPTTPKRTSTSQRHDNPMNDQQPSERPAKRMTTRDHDHQPSENLRRGCGSNSGSETVKKASKKTTSTRNAGPTERQTAVRTMVVDITNRGTAKG